MDIWTSQKSVREGRQHSDRQGDKGTFGQARKVLEMDINILTDRETKGHLDKREMC